MILSHKHKFIFFCNGKCGTTSIEHVLAPLQEGEAYDRGLYGVFVPKHIPPAILRGALPERVWREYHKVVFVRNPWDWFVSQWHYNAVEPAAAGARAPRRDLRARLGARLRGIRAHAAPDVAAGAVRQFTVADVDRLFELMKRFRGLPGEENFYQSNWAYDMDGRRIVDQVGRFETLGADFERMRERLGLPADLRLPHLNRTEHGDYRAYFSTESRERVAQRWARDLDNFGYRFDGSWDAALPR